MKKTKTTKESNPGAEVANKPEMKVGKILLAKKAAEEKEMKEGKYVPVSERPGTVDVYKAMENLSNAKANDAAETPSKKCARIAAERIEKTLKGKKAGGEGVKVNAFCLVHEVKDCVCFGVDPDRPDTVSNCGSYYQASVVISAGSPEINVSKMIEYSKVLEKVCGRQTFIKQYESKGLNEAVNFKVVFRIGKLHKVAKKAAKKAKK